MSRYLSLPGMSSPPLLDSPAPEGPRPCFLLCKPWLFIRDPVAANAVCFSTFHVANVLSPRVLPCSPAFVVNFSVMRQSIPRQVRPPIQETVAVTMQALL